VKLRKRKNGLQRKLEADKAVIELLVKEITDDGLTLRLPDISEQDKNELFAGELYRRMCRVRLAKHR
jgi:hypothetical protein